MAGGNPAAPLSRLTWTWLPVGLVSANRQAETRSWQEASQAPARHSGARPSPPGNFVPSGAGSSWPSAIAHRATYFQSIAWAGVSGDGGDAAGAAGTAWRSSARGP